MFLSNSVLLNILKEATEEERLSLTRIIEEEPSIKKALPYNELRKEICSIGGNSLVNIYRGDGTGYLDILDDVAKELKISKIPSYINKVKYFEEKSSLKYDREEAKQKGIKYAEEMEEKIILKVLELTYEKMTDDEKKSFDEQINKITKDFNSNATSYLTGTAGLLALGNLGGFATYTFLTTALSTLSIGILGFATYTGATALLSVILGPVGWAGLGAITILTLGAANTQKSIPIVATVGAIRQRIKYEKGDKK